MKISHPAFPEITKDVAAYAAWRDAGWIVHDHTPAKKPDTDQANGTSTEVADTKSTSSRSR